MNRRLLQITCALLGLIPVVTGIMAMLGLDNPFYASAGLPQSALLDSNLRFFGGLWLGLGLAMLWLIPSIERQTVLYRAIWGAILIGGLGRLCSLAVVGRPPVLFLVFMTLELSGPPFFLWWQHRVAREAAA